MSSLPAAIGSRELLPHERAELRANKLTPFAVPCDHELIYERFPETQGLEDVNVATVLDTLDPDSSRNRSVHGRVGEVTLSRTVRRGGLSTDILNNDYWLTMATVHLLSEMPVLEKPEQVVVELVRDAFNSLQGYIVDPKIRQVLTNYVPDDFEGLYNFRQAVNTRAKPVQEQAFRQCAENPATEYELLKLLLSVEHVPLHEAAKTDPEAFKDVQALRWLNMLIHIGPMASGSEFSQEMVRHLNKGDFDTSIASDLLLHLKELKEEDVRDERLSVLSTFVSLIEDAVGHELDQEALARLAESAKSWPAEHYRVIVSFRQELRNQLEYIRSKVFDMSNGTLFDPKEDYKSWLPEHVSNMLDYICDSDPRLVKRVRLPGLATAAVRAQSLKRRNLRTEDVNDDEQQPVQAETIAREPNKLVYFDSSGSTFDETSPQFDQMINEFLSGYGPDQNLKEDVIKIFDYLRKVDFTNGRISGVKKLRSGKSNVTINVDGNSVVLPLWELKPPEANGLSLKTNIATRTRTLFAIIDGQTVAIGGITHRERLDTLRKRIVAKG